MNNSQFNPNSQAQYSKSDLNADFKGLKFAATAGATTSGDLLLSHDYLIDGAIFFAKGAAMGDYVNFKIIDKDNVMGYGANTVLGQYVTTWYINPDSTFQADMKSIYPAKIFSGLYLRMDYISTGGTNVDVIINYKLHKVLW